MSQTLTETQQQAAETATVEHWIDGASVAGSSDRSGPVYNPALGVEQKRVRFASTEDVDLAVQAAARAFPAWRDTSIAKRQQVMFAFRELLNARTGELAAILTSEHGKVTSDAAGEIARGLEVVELACAMPGYTKGEYSENVSTGIDVYTLRQPVGVVGIISPFNFPAMVPLWFFPLAIATGNTVVLKPSEKDPSAAVWLAKLMQEAGPARRRAQRRARRQGRRRRAAAPPHRALDLVRRLDADRAVHLLDGHGQRQARAGARRREEPHARAARRRPRPRRRRRRERGLRLGRRALHGDLGRARGRLRSPTSSSRRSPSGCRG